MTMVLCNVDLWFINLYQTLKEILDGKVDRNMLECNQNTIIDRDGNFEAASSNLYSMYKLWCEKNGPEDRVASTRKFGLVMSSILGHSVMIRNGNITARSFISDMKKIEAKLKVRHGCDPMTINTDTDI